MEYKLNIDGQEVQAHSTEDLHMEVYKPRMVDLNDMIPVGIEVNNYKYMAFMLPEEFDRLRGKNKKA